MREPEPEFGKDTPLEKITIERIDAFRDRLLEDGKLSRRSVQKVLVLLHGSEQFREGQAKRCPEPCRELSRTERH